MVLNFVGEVDSISERQKAFIGEVLEQRGFHDRDVLIEQVGKPGDNYIANVKRIVVKQNNVTFKMIAKLAPENSSIRQMTNISDMFKNEHVIYTKVFPKFRELQKSAGIPEEEWFRHAECYGTFIEKPYEVILLEDLKESKFEILDRFKHTNNDCVKLVLKNFAVYHSLYYILKSQEPDTFSDLKSKFSDTYDAPSQMLEIRKKFGLKQEQSILPALNDKYKAAFQGTISNFNELVNEVKERVTDSTYSVIQQGDGWTNNIMFVLEDDQPTQCVLIDYQMTKENNPMYDIMYMIFNSTETEQRIQHYTEYIDHYYNELDMSLRNYGLKARDVYPRDQLHADMKSYAKIVLAISFIVTNLIIKDVEEANKLQEIMKIDIDATENTLAAMMEQTPETQVLFIQKIEALAKSFTELGLL